MAQLTPLLNQYHRIKERYKDSLLLFRVGDFYEMFYDDAKTGASALGLTLTSRSHGKNNRVPLAGIPAKSLDNYIQKLVAQGFKVAVCEQLEAPGLSRTIIKRDVIELITPGTVLRPTLLEEKRNNYILALPPRTPKESKIGMAFADLSTGEFYISEVDSATSLKEEIEKISPKEILVPKSLFATAHSLLTDSQYPLSSLEDYYFSYDFASAKLKSHFSLATLEGFGISEENSCALCAAGALLHYLESACAGEKNRLSYIQKISWFRESEYLFLDRFTRKNLELTERIQDNSETGTLFSILSRTRTPHGSRLLRRWLLSPLRSKDKIIQRLDAIEELLGDITRLRELGLLLKEIGDIERIAIRINLERANPREIVALKSYLNKIPEIHSLVKDSKSLLIRDLLTQFVDFSPVVQKIDETLVPEPPLTITEAGLIKAGANRELDEIRAYSIKGKEYIANLQKRERERTGIPNLRVGYNSVFGYYLEITKSYLSLVPKNYLRKQTLANCERFITPELKEYETKVLNSEERIRVLEYEIFVNLRKELADWTERLLNLARALAEIDVLQSLALVALENNYTRPEITDPGEEIVIVEGRHPVVEKMVPTPFIPNDTLLDNKSSQILLITGPNMAGKSTYLRQVALIVILAQMGSYVPAKSARIGIVDKIFTRIGASDDLARGVSTFLAEMTETANILNNATPKSLVILDEVGRGTATYDGLSIAWAVVEYLHQNPTLQPKTLFATHYHELTDIVEYLPRVKNYNFLVKESGDDIIFLRKLVPGKSSRSYGILVARLAGLPKEVIERAKEVLFDFEKGEELTIKSLSGDKTLQMSLFYPMEHPILEELRRLELNSLTPLEAINYLAELQKKALRIKEDKV